MGNCIGKKTGVQSKQRRHSPLISSRTKLHCNNNQLNTTKNLSKSLLSKQTNDYLSNLSNVKESDINEENEKKIIQYSPSPSLVQTTNAQFLLTHTSPILLVQCKKFKSSNTAIDSSENNVTDSNILITNEQDLTMGHLFSKEKEINNDQEVPIFNQETISELFDISSSPSLSDSSLSSLSCNTTSFSSQDQLILSSSSSSSNEINHHKFHSLLYSKQNHTDNQSLIEKLFSIILPLSTSRSNNNLFLNEFHQNIVFHNCKTLQSIIDNVSQQQFIQIHQRTKSILIEHKQLQCIHIKDLNPCQSPSLIFDEDQKLVYITKYSRINGLQSITSAIKNQSEIFSSCDNCSLIFSPLKFNNYLHKYFLINITYNLVQLCFNNINTTNNLFGYISKTNSNYIQQTIINNSKLTYSYDIDVEHTAFYFVIHIQSWPQEIYSMYEQRKRLWPLNIKDLFNNTCFIRFNTNSSQLIFTTDKCSNCENVFSLISNSSWSYTYAAIENQLVLNMSDGHIRFASILWNYLNGKTQGQFPFRIFKHTLFYFFEQYTSDSFTTSDLFSHIQIFIDFLFNRIQTKSIPHYFNINSNLYNDNISMILISIKINYFDIKKFSFFILPKSSLYIYHFIYLIQFQSNFLQYLRSSKTNLIETILDIHENVIKQLSLGVKIYNQQLESTTAIKSRSPLTLDCLYRYQEENVQLILDYLPLLREKEPSLFIHSIWSIFIQYFNSLFDDLFIS